MYADVRLITKRFMTGPQRKLFSYQRDRLHLLEDNLSSDSDLDQGLELRSAKALKKFHSTLG